MLEASLLDRDTPLQDIYTICNKPFIPEGRQAYCGAVCKARATAARAVSVCVKNGVKRELSVTIYRLQKPAFARLLQGGFIGV